MMITSKNIRLFLQLFEEKDSETSFFSKVSFKFMTGRKIFLKQTYNIKRFNQITYYFKAKRFNRF